MCILSITHSNCVQFIWSFDPSSPSLRGVGGGGDNLCVVCKGTGRRGSSAGTAMGGQVDEGGLIRGNDDRLALR